MSATIRTTQPAVCPLDCPDTCSLSVTVENGQIRGVRGSRANPYTDKAICSKVAKYYPDYVHGSQRLLYPLQRTGPRGSGQFERISWAAALDQVHAGFQRAMDTYGPQSVVGFNYAGPHGELAGGSMDRRFFHALGASCLDRGPLCGGVRSLAYTSLFGHAPGLPPEQLLHSDLILLWSSNTTVSALHLARTIRKAQENGARLVVIDPRRTTMAERADLFLQLKPDTDVVLALALAAELERRFGIATDFVAQWVHGHEAYLEQARRFTVADVESICGISAAQFRQLADWYLTAQRVGLAISNGMERGRNGGSGLRAAMALQALSGNFGRPGAGVVAKAGFAFPRNSNALQRPDLLPPDTRTLNILDVSRAILTQDFDPPVRALMIYNHNPLAVHPEQERMRAALMHEALFIAGSDVVMTDSMRYADVILPAASVFETDDVYGSYGHTWLQRGQAVIPLQGEALPNTEIFRRLAQRFGLDDPAFRASDAELMEAAFMIGDARLQGMTAAELPLVQALRMDAADGQPALMCHNIVPATPSGRIELYSADLQQAHGLGVPDYQPVAREDTYPLRILSPSSDQRINATFGGCADSPALQVLDIHPADAAARGIAEGDTVRVWNARGEVVFRARVSDAVQPGVLCTSKGAWLASSPGGRTVNALMSADLRTDIGAGACYNDTFVEVEPGITI